MRSPTACNSPVAPTSAWPIASRLRDRQPSGRPAATTTDGRHSPPPSPQGLGSQRGADVAAVEELRISVERSLELGGVLAEVTGVRVDIHAADNDDPLTMLALYPRRVGGPAAVSSSAADTPSSAGPRWQASARAPRARQRRFPL